MEGKREVEGTSVFPPCVRIVGREGCQGDLDAHFCWCISGKKTQEKKKAMILLRLWFSAAVY